jgi:hypothetical protein
LGRPRRRAAEGAREKKWEGARGEGGVVKKKKKKTVEWAHVVVVCMEYEI